MSIFYYFIYNMSFQSKN